MVVTAGHGVVQSEVQGVCVDWGRLQSELSCIWRMRITRETNGHEEIAHLGAKVCDGALDKALVIVRHRAPREKQNEFLSRVILQRDVAGKRRVAARCEEDKVTRDNKGPARTRRSTWCRWERDGRLSPG